ncbi:ATP-binding protein [Streptomyces erythrochromogenes]|uniref:ATP-binding protein n=1 Tax=Streptomyces erythrochromogenes TaxID=285574 RepID=UPI0036CA5394
MGPCSSTAVHHREILFDPGDEAACSTGIAHVRQALADWQLTAADDGNAVLVAAELLTNAAKYAGGPQRLSIDHRGDRLHLAVTDPSPVSPRLGEHRPDTIGGHGIFLIDRIALRWGTRPDGTGKTVWADLALPTAR